jgi:transcriptional regulator with XRE-family HTH domain
MQSHERLRHARERAGYVRGTDAARAFGWPLSTYLGHENGSRGITKEAAERYAKALKVTWEWLMGSDDEHGGAPAGVPIYWEVEPGAFRTRSPLEVEYCDTIPVGVWGYEQAQLFSVTMKDNGSNLYLICAPKTEDFWVEMEEVVIERWDTDGKSEIAVWEAFRDVEGVPRFRSTRGAKHDARSPTIAELTSATHKIHGFVVASYRVFDRQNRWGINQTTEE